MQAILVWFSMRVLIIESNPDLGLVWKNHLTRQGIDVTLVAGEEAAIRVLRANMPDVILLNLSLGVGSNALAVIDFAACFRPQTRVILVSRAGFFSDPAVFSLASTACTVLPEAVPLDDLCAIVDHYGGGVRPKGGARRLDSV